MKKNIRSIANALDTLSLMQPVEWEWITEDDVDADAVVLAGFVAQDLEEYFPTWVVEAAPPSEFEWVFDGEPMKAINLDQYFEALLVQSIKDLRAEKDSLEQHVALLEKELWALKVLVCADNPTAPSCNRAD